MRKNFILVIFLGLIFMLNFSEARAWTTNESVASNHSGLIDVALRQSSLKGKISANNIKIMKATAKLADEDAKYDGYSTGCVYLHAAGNYVLTSNLLLDISVEVKNSTNGSVVAVDRVKARYEEKYGKQDTITRVTDKVKELLAQDVIKNFDEGSPEIRSWKILGFLSHLVGDVYAHRTIVPISSVEVTNPMKADYARGILGTDDFPTNGKNDTCKVESVTTASGDLISGKNNALKYYASVQGSSIGTPAQTFNCIQDSIFLEVIEFRDIKAYQIKANQNMLYEDNGAFYPNRYKHASVWANLKIINGLQLNEKFNEYTYGYDAWTGANPKLNIKLNNLKKYYEYVGITTREDSQNWIDAWPKMSTDSLV